MKNPFQKEDNTGIIVAAVVGAVAAGAAAYLLFTESGSSVREKIADQFNSLRNSISGSNSGEDASQQEHHHDQSYMQEPHKAPKTDREKLLKHEILHG